MKRKRDQDLDLIASVRSLTKPKDNSQSQSQNNGKKLSSLKSKKTKATEEEVSEEFSVASDGEISIENGVDKDEEEDDDLIRNSVKRSNRNAKIIIDEDDGSEYGG